VRFRGAQFEPGVIERPDAVVVFVDAFGDQDGGYADSIRKTVAGFSGDG
jgi:hypothetical protein